MPSAEPPGRLLQGGKRRPTNPPSSSRITTNNKNKNVISTDVEKQALNNGDNGSSSNSNINNDGAGTMPILDLIKHRFGYIMMAFTAIGAFSFAVMYKDVIFYEKPLIANSRTKPHMAHPTSDVNIINPGVNGTTKNVDIAKWGHWQFVDPKANKVIRPEWDEYEAVFNANGIENRDAPNHTFPKGAWQADPEYMDVFFTEALALVNRTKEAIYHAYGATDPSDTERRKKMFGIKKYNTTQEAKKSFTLYKSYDGLKRRLLHAMMTHDNFEVVMGGHSAAAGHGNHFNQSYMMQFQTTLEPVFTRLGMNLISRNMAQGGLGTLQQSMTGMDIRGPNADIMMWDSGMTEKDGAAQEFFHRQALLGGKRAPMLWNGPVKDLHDGTGADIAQLMDWPEELPYTKDEVQVQTLPYAAQYLSCEKDVNLCGNKYSTGCWVDRPDITPEKKQDSKVGGTASWHPGFRYHMWRGRAMAFFVLEALEDAIKLWRDVTSTQGHPLPDEHWHVTQHYKAIQEKALTMEGKCEKDFFMPKLCKIPMHGVSEFTPRYNPDHTSIRSIVKQPEGKYRVELTDTILYDGPDVPNPWTQIPEGEIDVNAIAGGRRLVSTRPNQPQSLSSSLAADVVEIESNGRQSERLLGEGEDDIRNIIFPGSGWYVEQARTGFCDGSIASRCGRGKKYSCLLSGHNDGRGEIVGDENSGWLIMNIKDLKHGIIIVRMEVWHGGKENKRTKDWTEYNNGIWPDGLKRNDTVVPNGSADEKSDAHKWKDYCKYDKDDDKKDENDENHIRRQLKGAPPPLPDDFKFDIAINGEITTQDRCEFTRGGESGKRLAYNFDVFTLLDDPTKTGDVEVAIRMRGGRQQATLWLSHVYWA